MASSEVTLAILELGFVRGLWISLGFNGNMVVGLMADLVRLLCSKFYLAVFIIDDYSSSSEQLQSLRNAVFNISVTPRGLFTASSETVLLYNCMSCSETGWPRSSRI